MKKTTKLLGSLLSLCLAWGAVIPAFAQGPSVAKIQTAPVATVLANVKLPSISTSKPIQTYTINTSGKVYAYTSSNLKVRTGGYIDCATDLCKIIQVSGNAVRVTYPVSRGTKTAWFSRSAFTSYNIAGGASNTWKQSRTINTYTRRDGKTKFGSISANDTCYKLGAYGSYTQVIYPVSGGYKMGWVKSSDISTSSSSGSASQTNTSKTPIGLTSKTVAEGDYVLYSAVGSNMVADVYGASSKSGANIQIYPYNGGSNQVFTVKKYGNYYYLKPKCSGLAMDVYGASAASGANVQQWTVNTTAAQMWQFADAGSGYYYIVNKNGKVLDVNGGTAKAETNVQVYTFNRSKAQKWKLVKYTAPSGDCAA